MATKYDQSSATRPVSIRSHTSAFQVRFKHTSSALEMSSVNPPYVPAESSGPSTVQFVHPCANRPNTPSYANKRQPLETSDKTWPQGCLEG